MGKLGMTRAETSINFLIRDIFFTGSPFFFSLYYTGKQ